MKGDNVLAHGRRRTSVFCVPDSRYRQPRDRCEVHEADDAHRAASVVRGAALADGIAANPTKLDLHCDNGANLKATTVLARLTWLEMKPSHSGSLASNHSALTELAFIAAIHWPEYVRREFKDLNAARRSSITFTSRRKPPTQGAGLATPGTGRPSAPALSPLETRSASKPNHPIKVKQQ